MDSDMKAMIGYVRQSLKEEYQLDDKSIDTVFEKTQFLEMCVEDPGMVYHYQPSDWAKELIEVFEKGDYLLHKRSFIESVVNELVKYYKVDKETAKKMVKNYNLSALFDKYPEQLNHLSPDVLNREIYESQKHLFQDLESKDS